MSWELTRQYIDHQTGMHVMHLEHSVTKAHHVVQIWIGQDSCPTCGHVVPKDNIGQLDPRALLAKEMLALGSVHANIEVYAKKHGIPRKK